jgi:N-acyl-D-aspartate/D-glutamate deacylase
MKADVVVADGRIQTVGAVGHREDCEQIDLSGLVLAPGFIDPHTHYDAQLLWDPDLTPSSWHGVTTVVMGNCGFTLAPTRPECREPVMQMLSNVEGMSYDALDQGITWTFSTYSEYLDAIESRPIRLNVASLIGHSAVRYYVMGMEAEERTATPAEIAAMRQVVYDALRAGAIGFSTSRSTSHFGARSRPVPSRVGAEDEIGKVAQALRDAQSGILEATWGPDLFVEEFARLAEDLRRPVTWAAVLTQPGDPEWTRRIMEDSERFGGDVHPQMACKPLMLQIDLGKPGTMSALPVFADALSRPTDERLQLFDSPHWRAAAAAQLADHPVWTDRLNRAEVQESVADPGLVHAGPLGELARARARSSLDLLLDLVVADRMQTRLAVLVMNEAEDEVAAMLNNKRLLLGLSDAGAHANQLCDANAPTYLLSHWWREREAISLENAVWRLTGHPASVFGLTDRGAVRPGFMADLVAFDPVTVGGGPLARRHDFPGGSDRLVVESTGVEHVWVRGQRIRRAGQPVPAAYPGALLRGGRTPS